MRKKRSRRSSPRWPATWRGFGPRLNYPATANVIDQTPVSCQTPQGRVKVSTDDPPVYCPSDTSLDLTVGFIQGHVEPIGDAAVLLVVADLYGYHLLNAL